MAPQEKKQEGLLLGVLRTECYARETSKTTKSSSPGRAIACITNDSKAASWKAHWLTLRTENISAGRAQPITLTDWDTFEQEFLGNFVDPSETQRMQRHLVEMRQKTSSRDHTREINRTAPLAGMNGNAALPWRYLQSRPTLFLQETVHFPQEFTLYVRCSYGSAAFPFIPARSTARLISRVWSRLDVFCLISTRCRCIR